MTLRTVGHQAMTGLMGLVFPPTCLTCGRWRGDEESGFCPACARSLHAVVGQFYCPRCGMGAGTFSDGNPGPDEKETRCAVCPPRRLPWRRLIRVGKYEGLMATLVRQFKFHGRSELARLLGDWLWSAVEGAGQGRSGDLIVHIPQPWFRHVKRGYNPAELIASRLSRLSKVPLGHVLVRRKSIPRQTTLPRSRRWDNVRGAFGIRHSRCLDKARVWLVDDVMTTGATAAEAARTLLTAGAGEVRILILARAETAHVH